MAGRPSKRCWPRARPSRASCALPTARCTRGARAATSTSGRPAPPCSSASPVRTCAAWASGPAVSMRAATRPRTDTTWPPRTTAASRSRSCSPSRRSSDLSRAPRWPRPAPWTSRSSSARWRAYPARGTAAAGTPAPAAAGRCSSCSRRRCAGGVERLRQIGDEVLHVLDADSEPDQAVVDPDRLALLRGQLEVGHQRGLLDERLDRAERRRDGGQLARVDEPRRLAQPAFEQEAHHSAESLHLLAGDGVVGMARQAGVEDPEDASLRLQPLGTL